MLAPGSWSPLVTGGHRWSPVILGSVTETTRRGGLAHLVEGQLGVLNAALLGAPAPVKVVERGTVYLATRILHAK